MPFLVLTLVAPIFVMIIIANERHSITKQDEINAILGFWAFIIYLIFGPNAPNESEVLGALLIASILCLIWLIFYVLPWAEISLLIIVALVSLIMLFGQESSIGQFLVFITASIGVFSLLGLKVSSDSLRARYWRANWVQPSPLEAKLGRDLVYEVPLIDSPGTSKSSETNNTDTSSVVRSPLYSGQLDIQFYPPNPKQFKAFLLQSKEAWVLLHKSNGQKDLHHWNASRFTERSNLMNNLRSGYLRNWRKKGILKAEIAINKSDIV